MLNTFFRKSIFPAEVDNSLSNLSKLRMTTNSYKLWWDKANEQLDKISPSHENPLRMILETLYSEFNLAGLSPPCVEKGWDEEDFFLTWENDDENRIVVHSDENLDCTITIPKHNFTASLPLKDDEVDILYTMFPLTLENEPEEEFATMVSQPPPAETPKKEEVDMNKMLNSMLNKFDKLMGDMNELKEENNEPAVSSLKNIDSMGMCLRCLVVGIVSILAWLLNHVGSRFPGRALIKTIVIETMEDVRGGYWDDIFETPGEWIKERSETLYTLFEYVFQSIHWMIRYNRISVPALAFMIGRYL